MNVIIFLEKKNNIVRIVRQYKQVKKAHVN